MVSCGKLLLWRIKSYKILAVPLFFTIFACPLLKNHASGKGEANIHTEKGVYLTLWVWRIGIWQFQTISQKQSNSWRPLDVFIWCFWVSGHFGWMSRVSMIYISAWASTLLVLTNRAMPEPQCVGRVTRELPRCLCISIVVISVRGVGRWLFTP